MRRVVALLVAAGTATAAALAGAVPAAAAAPPLPSADPFYQYANTAQGKAGVPLASIAPGTVLAERQVDLALATNTAPTPTGLPLPATLPTTAEQLLYRTADQQGRPSVTVTTVIEPATGPVAPRIVAYLSFYDALSDKCDPSYTLRGGDPGSASATLTDAEQVLVEAYAADAVVTVPDFEGEGLHWTAGYEAGYDTLDAIRATESYLKAPASTMVGLTGYSGGSIAADWASELAPTYAPELNIVGVAEGGIPVDFAHNLTYINGSQSWSGVIPAVLVALSRAFGLDLATYLSPYGLKLTAAVANECIGDFSGSVPAGLKIEQILKPQYQDIFSVPAFDDIINKLIMGTAPGHPAGPLLMGVGNDPKNAQGQGDDVMVTADVEALAHEYCSQGVAVQYEEYANSTHEQAALQFEPQAIAFLQERFLGAPFTGNCSSVGTGSSLAPVAPSASAPPSTAPATPSAAPVAAGRSGTGGDLAFTGAEPDVALVALALAAGGGAALGLRRRTRRR